MYSAQLFDSIFTPYVILVIRYALGITILSLEIDSSNFQVDEREKDFSLVKFADLATGGVDQLARNRYSQ